MNAVAILQRLEKVVETAALRVLEHYRLKDPEAEIKADKSPLTAADRASHTLLAAALPSILAVPVVSEEAPETPEAKAATVRNSEYCWLVDPLDGTRDFLARTNDFTINVALMARGEPVIGCVMAPARRVMYSGARGVGAFRSNAGGAKRRAMGRPFLEGNFVCLVSRQHQSGEVENLRRLWPDATYLAVGSAYKYGLIAEGAADLSVRYGTTSAWDTAPSQLILELAGGGLLGFDGRPLRYCQDGLANPPFLAVGDASKDWGAFAAKLR